MQKVPYDIWSQYDAFLKAKVKDISQHQDLRKWLRYYLDFRSKYHFLASPTPLLSQSQRLVRLFSPLRCAFLAVLELNNAKPYLQIPSLENTL